MVEMYHFNTASISVEDEFILMRWGHGDTACYVDDYSIQVHCLDRPIQYFSVDEKSISQAASQIMSGIISHRDHINEFYGGDLHGATCR